jgi:DNA-binding response OmpR family regulator
MCLNRQNSAERIRAPSGDRGRRPAVGNIEVEARRRRVCVDIAGSAADAEAALELINYDVAILDLGLPDGDGLAVLAAARRSARCCRS